MAASGLSESPANNIYGYVDVVKYGANFIGQNVYSYTSSGMVLYARRRSDGTWGSWDSFALTTKVNWEYTQGTNGDLLKSSPVAFARKYNSTNSSATVKFEAHNQNRYVGILFISNNSGNHGIFCVSYKYGTTSTVTKIFGGADDNAVTIDSNGDINVSMSSWSEVALLYNGSDRVIY